MFSCFGNAGPGGEKRDGAAEKNSSGRCVLILPKLFEEELVSYMHFNMQLSEMFDSEAILFSRWVLLHTGIQYAREEEL